MFKSLKDKFSSWLSTEKEAPEPVKKTKKTTKKTAKAPSKKEEKLTRKKTKHSKKKELEKEVEPANSESKKEITKQTEEKPQEPTEKVLQQPEEKPSFFSKLKKKLSTSELSSEQFDSLFEEFELTLLENNVSLAAVDHIHSSLAKDLVGISIKKSDIDSTIITSLKESILSLLIEPPNLLEQIKKHSKYKPDPYIIAFFGINGSGKTTSIAKLAHYLKAGGLSVVLAAGDTFRAASIEQLEVHASALSIPIIKQTYGSDPAAVAFDAIKYAKSNKIDVVLIDTAGRMYTATNLLREMEKIIRISKPQLKIFVAESITGNDVVSQCNAFNEFIGIDGIILSKSDIDEKGGAILSISQATKKPIYFLGNGQLYKDLEIFNKEKILERLGL
tara:strand:- start:1100 stop:2266 length:1167 start_codon:yes stop_codon:yes gene_type:complete